MKTLKLWCLICLLSTAPGFVLILDVVCAAPSVLISVFRTSEVNRDDIRLGDISDITGQDAKFIKKLNGVAIGRSPLPGKSRSIDEDRIRLRLKQYDIDEARARLEVPDNAQVTRGSAVVSEIKIREVVMAYIAQVLPLQQNGIRVKDIQIRKEVVVPKGHITFQVEPPANSDFCGKTPFSVSIFVEGEFERKIWAVADIEILKEVLVTTKPLKRYREITEDDIEVREMDMAELPSQTLTDYGDILGKRARKNIPLNTVLRADMIEFPPLVKRGDMVVVIAESAGLRITAMGIVKEREGRLGERIRVENVDSKRSIYAQVVDSKTVKVDF